MAKIKDLSRIAEKFQSVTPARASEYERGVEESPVDCAKATAEAESAFEGGINKAIAAKRFGKGVKKAGSEKYKEGVRRHGGSRFAAGVAVAGPAYEKGFAPYHRVIAGTELPPRGPRRSPQNLRRVEVIATALGRAKEAGAS